MKSRKATRWLILNVVLISALAIQFQNCTSPKFGSQQNLLSSNDGNQDDSSNGNYSAPQLTVSTIPQSLNGLITSINSVTVSLQVDVDNRLNVGSTKCLLKRENTIVSDEPCVDLSKQYSNLIDGRYQLNISATDSRNQNTNDYNFIFTIDTTKPILSANVTGTTTKTFTFDASDNLSTSSQIQFRCSLNNATFSGCVSPAVYQNFPSGSNSVRIEAIDAAGNISQTYSHNWTNDPGMASVNITSPIAAFTNSSAISIAFTGTSASGGSLSMYECSLNGSAFASCSSPQSYNNLNGVQSFQVRGLIGNNQFTAVASANWTIDLDKPIAPTITTPTTSPTKETTIIFNFSSSDNSGGSGIASYMCSLNGAAFTSNCTSPRTITVSSGQHSFRVKAIDRAGNESDITTHSWTVTPDWIMSNIELIQGSGATFDLKSTLPAGTKTGGTFSVDASGAQLPAGMTLTSAGILSVGTATEITIDGVVFVYDEPL